MVVSILVPSANDKINVDQCIAAKLLKLVERAVLDPKKEGKPWLREGNFDWCI